MSQHQRYALNLGNWISDGMHQCSKKNLLSLISFTLLSRGSW